jgi:hypothetical protein
VRVVASVVEVESKCFTPPSSGRRRIDLSRVSVNIWRVNALLGKSKASPNTSRILEPYARELPIVREVTPVCNREMKKVAVSLHFTSIRDQEA